MRPSSFLAGSPAALVTRGRSLTPTRSATLHPCTPLTHTAVPYCPRAALQLRPFGRRRTSSGQLAEELPSHGALEPLRVRIGAVAPHPCLRAPPSAHRSPPLLAARPPQQVPLLHMDMGGVLAGAASRRTHRPGLALPRVIGAGGTFSVQPVNLRKRALDGTIGGGGGGGAAAVSTPGMPSRATLAPSPIVCSPQGGTRRLGSSPTSHFRALSPLVAMDRCAIASDDDDEEEEEEEREEGEEERMWRPGLLAAGAGIGVGVGKRLHLVVGGAAAMVVDE